MHHCMPSTLYQNFVINIYVAFLLVFMLVTVHYKFVSTQSYYSDDGSCNCWNMSCQFSNLKVSSFELNYLFYTHFLAFISQILGKDLVLKFPQFFNHSDQFIFLILKSDYHNIIFLGIQELFKCHHYWQIGQAFHFPMFTNIMSL